MFLLCHYYFNFSINCHPFVRRQFHPFLNLNLSFLGCVDCDLVRERTCLYVFILQSHYSFMQFLLTGTFGCLQKILIFLSFIVSLNFSWTPAQWLGSGRATFMWNQKHIKPFSHDIVQFKRCHCRSISCTFFQFNSLLSLEKVWLQIRLTFCINYENSNLIKSRFVVRSCEIVFIMQIDNVSNYKRGQKAKKTFE